MPPQTPPPSAPAAKPADNRSSPAHTPSPGPANADTGSPTPSRPPPTTRGLPHLDIQPGVAAHMHFPLEHRRESPRRELRCTLQPARSRCSVEQFAELACPPWRRWIPVQQTVSRILGRTSGYLLSSLTTKQRPRTLGASA